MFGIPRPLLVLLVAAAAAGCSNPTNPSNPSNPGSRSAFAGNAGGSAVIIPNAPAGDSASRGAVDAATARPTQALTSDQQRVVFERRRCEAERLWNRAVQLECTNPGAAGKIFKSITDDYPEYERAAEARFREGLAYYRARQYGKASVALVEYMRLAPVNPHLAEVEELLYESGVRYLGRRKRFFGIFSGDQEGLDGLEFLSETFTAGEYADDAILALGDYFKKEGEWMAATLHYKELLLRYPDSEWSFKARLRLADTYFCRDQGPPYNAGYVVLDPREKVPEAALIMGGPIESALELALEQYESYLERMQADPARMAEYAQEVEYARCMRQKCREGIAAKDLHRGDWYKSRGERCAALGYWRGAASWEQTRAGTTAESRIQAATGQAYQRGLAPCPPCPEPLPTRQVPTRPLPTRPLPTRPLPTRPVPTRPVPTRPVPAAPPPVQAVPRQAVPRQPTPARPTPTPMPTPMPPPMPPPMPVTPQAAPPRPATPPAPVPAAGGLPPPTIRTVPR